MKTWFWLFLAMLTLMAGCAPGYDANKSANPAEAPAFQDSRMWRQNPETDSEQPGR